MSVSVMSIVQRGSAWARWEAHIHATGTLLADKFSEDECLSALEGVTPVLSANGVTGYSSQLVNIDQFCD